MILDDKIARQQIQAMKDLSKELDNMTRALKQLTFTMIEIEKRHQQELKT